MPGNDDSAEGSEDDRPRSSGDGTGSGNVDSVDRSHDAEEADVTQAGGTDRPDDDGHGPDAEGADSAQIDDGPTDADGTDPGRSDADPTGGTGIESERSAEGRERSVEGQEPPVEEQEPSDEGQEPSVRGQTETVPGRSGRDGTGTGQSDSTGSAHGPAPEPGTAAASDDDRGPVRWFLTTDQESVALIRDVVVTVGSVLMIGVLLFAISGIWPPLVAVESGSMEPHMYRGDLVFIVDEHRFSGDQAVAGTGIVTWRQGKESGYWSFGNYGNVIVFEPNGRDGTPIIHRARFWVEEDENWIDPPSEGGTGKANLTYLRGGDDCTDYPDTVCPAPNDGFITKGDANGGYDQIAGRSRPVKPEWIRGTAKVRIPYLGWVRLTFSGR